MIIGLSHLMLINYASLKYNLRINPFTSEDPKPGNYN
jgi:hypothetical protein